jgi:trehalose synthase
VEAGIERIAIQSHCGLDDYSAHASLAPLVRELRDEARLLQPRLAQRAVWMLSSTAAGGGVAEMMPRLVALLGELGLDARWLVMRAEPQFFALTKRLHNLIHGAGDPQLGATDRQLYEKVSQRCGELLTGMLAPSDLLVVHDPQPLGAGAWAKRALGLRAIWRCHIGHGEDSAQARAAWCFLQPYAAAYERAVFSAPEYIRDFLAGRGSLMHPSIDPLDHKNRELAPTKLVGILASAGLLGSVHPVLAPPFPAQARRLHRDGSYVPALGDNEIGLLFRPIVAQVSRWDRLKGFAPLLDGFCALKQRIGHARNPRHRRRLEIVRLVLAGPDPAAVQDDPEALEVLTELSRRYARLPPSLANDIALLVLPMTSRKHNALMVNCLQRCAALVVQNSLREGFSLTVTEAMWKGVAVLGTRSTGIRQQVRDHLDGRLLANPDDPHEIAEVLDQMLAASKQRQEWGRNAHRRVYDAFLIFRQLRDWLRLFAECAG